MPKLDVLCAMAILTHAGNEDDDDHDNNTDDDQMAVVLVVLGGKGGGSITHCMEKDGHCTFYH